MELRIVNGKLEALVIKSIGLSIQRTKALTGVTESRSMSWLWPFIREPFTGAWQRNEEISLDSALANPTIYACITLIATDMAKMRPRLMEFAADQPAASAGNIGDPARQSRGVWVETQNPAYSPLLRKPNHFQTWFQFVEWWITSKLTHGNAYALKQRDQRGVVTRLYLLDPTRVKLLASTDGSFFYELTPNNNNGDLGLSENRKTVIVPAREIVHDVQSPLFHPKIGVSPIFAAGWPALLAKHINTNSQKLFANGSSPGGVLTAPGFIQKETAERVKEYFDQNFSGENFGRVAVLGDGLTYTPLGMATAVDSQMIEILKWSDEQIAKCFHMPLFKVGGPLPPYSSVEAVTQIYYSDCLQAHCTAFERVLTEGLEMDPIKMAVSLDIDDLNRMDSATAMDIATKGVAGSVFTPNEARRRFDLPPLTGGNTVYLQQQNYSLAALQRRDAQDDPFKTATPAPKELPAGNEPEPEPETAEKSLDILRGKVMRLMVKSTGDAAA